jgi:tRNA (guanine37-N1)-methyltransferase
MELHVISIFPEMFGLLTEQGVIARAIDKGLVSLKIWNPRDFTEDKHRMVDDRPYGGGPGMVMMVEPLAKAIKSAKAACSSDKPKVVYLSPQGRQIKHANVLDFADEQALILIAGRYEGLDQRVIDNLVDEEWSIGDYVLSGGELPSMVLIDAIVRQLPDSLGNNESAQQDSFADGLLDCPHYTRPESIDFGFGENSVPDVLLSGDHQAIATWRQQQALGATWLKRPDLLDQSELSALDQALLDEFIQQAGRKESGKK